MPKYDDPRSPFMLPHAARLSTPPKDFEFDGCSCFPDRIPGFKGRIDLTPACKIHDWHYAILRKHQYAWCEDVRQEFREWADAGFQMRIVAAARAKLPRWVADALARAMWAAVRTFGRGAC